jgi:Transposase DDE domain
VRAAAIDSTVLRAKGRLWHKMDRAAGVVPHTAIATEAGWTKSSWHGWVYGWKLHVVCTVGWVWLPLAADHTTAPEADNVRAPALIRELPLELRFLLGDQHFVPQSSRMRLGWVWLTATAAGWLVCGVVVFARSPQAVVAHRSPLCYSSRDSGISPLADHSARWS